MPIMPIVIDVVSKAKFDDWVKEAQSKFAKVDGTPPAADVAQNQPSN